MYIFYTKCRFNILPLRFLHSFAILLLACGTMLLYDIVVFIKSLYYTSTSE